MNHKLVIDSRFPHFRNLFVFYKNNIVAIKQDFQWNSWNASTILNYVINTSYNEKPLIEKYTDFDMFIKRLREAPRLS